MTTDPKALIEMARDQIGAANLHWHFRPTLIEITNLLESSLAENAKLRAQNRKYRAALYRIWCPDYVMKNDVHWAYGILQERCDLAKTVLGDDRMNFDEMDEEIMAWKGKAP